jgi:tetratricopeptide (TPR) repeat protein
VTEERRYLSELYSLKDVADLFSLQEARLRYWAQTGFVGPSVRKGSRVFYTFQDLIGVKVAKDLLDSGLPMQRVRRNLDALRAALPGVDRPLTRLRVCSDGNDVVVVADDVAFEPTSGQLVMSFAVGSLSEKIAQLLPLRASAGQPATAAQAPSTAYACFLSAVSADDAGDTGRAEELYRRALALDANFPAAWTNLGNILERRGARGDARAAYDRALEQDPDLPEARYNLANLLADTGEDELALAEYRRVVAAIPTVADAHFNLALLLLRVGAPAQARTHLERYLELDAATDWSTRARALLATLS